MLHIIFLFISLFGLSVVFFQLLNLTQMFANLDYLAKKTM